MRILDVNENIQNGFLEDVNNTEAILRISYIPEDISKLKFTGNHAAPPTVGSSYTEQNNHVNMWEIIRNTDICTDNHMMQGTVISANMEQFQDLSPIPEELQWSEEHLCAEELYSYLGGPSSCKTLQRPHISALHNDITVANIPLTVEQTALMSETPDVPGSIRLTRFKRRKDSHGTFSHSAHLIWC